MSTRCEDFQLIGVGPVPQEGAELHGRHLWNDQRWHNIAKRGENLALTVRRPVKDVATPLALRPLSLVTSESREKYVSAVFRGFFELGVDIDSPPALLEFIAREGLDIMPLKQALEDQETQCGVEADALLWDTRRLRLLPTLEYGLERMAGILDKRGVENFLSLLFD